MSSTPIMNGSRHCRICLTAPTCPTTTPCRHTFCYECITTHLSSRNVCPMCSTFLTVQCLQPQTAPPLDSNDSDNISNDHPSTPSSPPPTTSQHQLLSPANSPPRTDRTPDITTSISSRRNAPPPLRTHHPTRSSPSSQAERLMRAEAIVQRINPPPPHLQPSHHPLHHHMQPSLLSTAPQATTTPSFLHPSLPSTFAAAVVFTAAPATASDTESNSAVLAPAASSSVVAASPSIGLPRKLPPFSSPSQANSSKADVLLAATESLSAEQLSDFITHLSQILQKKERSDRHVENHLLLHFLKHSRRQKETKLRRIQAQLDVLTADIRATESQRTLQRSPESYPLHPNNTHIVPLDSPVDSMRDDHRLSQKRQRVVENFGVLENQYITTVGQKTGESRKKALQYFTDDVFKLTQFSRLQDRATLMHVARVPDAPGGDVFRASNIVSSMEFDRDSEFLATAGVTKKIKIFEFSNISRNLTDVHYPIREISSQAKLSWVCWNPYIRHHLLSSDYEGLVKIWDVNLATALSEYEEHEARAWSVDYCPKKPAYFASGSDDGTVKIWTTTQRNSVMTIDNKKANVCSVKFHPTTPELLAFGSVDQNVQYYDLRNPRHPLQTFKSHSRAVSYVKFMSNNALVSASVDSTVKMWDLQSLSLTRTFMGHANDKNFVGLSVTSDYIACGSEENMVYCYYKAIPPPLTAFRFSSTDPLTGEEIADGEDLQQFVSSVCWCPNDPSMLVAANSLGSMKVLKLDSEDDADEDSEEQERPNRMREDNSSD